MPNNDKRAAPQQAELVAKPIVAGLTGRAGVIDGKAKNYQPRLERVTELTHSVQVRMQTEARPDLHTCCADLKPWSTRTILRRRQERPLQVHEVQTKAR